MIMACSTQGSKEECVEGFGAGARKEDLLGREM
jgi:hypothetical protein